MVFCIKSSPNNVLHHIYPIADMLSSPRNNVGFHYREQDMLEEGTLHPIIQYIMITCIWLGQTVPLSPIVPILYNWVTTSPYQLMTFLISL